MDVHAESPPKEADGVDDETGEEEAKGDSEEEGGQEEQGGDKESEGGGEEEEAEEEADEEDEEPQDIKPHLEAGLSCIVSSYLEKARRLYTNQLTCFPQIPTLHFIPITFLPPTSLVSVYIYSSSSHPNFPLPNNYPRTNLSQNQNAPAHPNAPL